MRLFIGAFLLDPRKPDYRDRVLSYGKDAEKQLQSFLGTEGVRATGSSSILKYMRAFHRRGKLNGYIREHKALLATGAIVDPSPRDTQDALTIKVAE